MIFQDNFYFLQSLTGIILLGLTVYTYRFKDSPVSRSLMVFLILTAFWCFMAPVIGQISELHDKIIFNRIKLLAPIFLPTCILNLALNINGEIKLNRVVLFLPAFFFGCIIISPWHELFINGYAIERIQGQDLFVFKNGPLFFIHSNLSRLFCLLSFWIIYKGMKGRHRFQKNTGWVIIAAIFFPFLVDTIAVHYYEIFRYLQLVPVSLGVTSILITYALFIHGSLEIIPYARSQVVSELSEPCLMWNPKGRLVDINRSGSLLFGLYNDLREFDHSQYPFLKTHNQEVVWIDGRVFQVRFENIQDLSGRVLGSFSLLREITQIKKAEENLLKMNQVKTNLLGVISHDLCGHAGQLSFITELLATNHQDLSSEENIQLLQGASFLSKDLNFFLSNLLDWSKEQYKDWEPKREKVHLKEMIQTIWLFLNKSANLKNQKLQNDIEDESFVQTDQQMFEIVLRNLIYNAIKHSKEGSIIKVWMTEKCLHIWNQGDVKDVELMNDYFAGEENVPGYSNGMGHKICKEFAEALSVRITASALDDGVHFAIHLN